MVGIWLGQQFFNHTDGVCLLIGGFQLLCDNLIIDRFGVRSPILLFDSG